MVTFSNIKFLGENYFYDFVIVSVRIILKDNFLNIKQFDDI